MCEVPGDSYLTLDREAGVVRGHVRCGCGEHGHEVRIGPESTLGMPYRPAPEVYPRPSLKDPRSRRGARRT